MPRLGTLALYADDFAAMCDTKAAVEETHRRVSTVLARLGLELHPEKTRMADLSRGREAFDFLGCHLRKRMSGPIWERTQRRVYYLHRCPSQRAMARVRARVRAHTPRARCHEDLRVVLANLNRTLRGWGAYFRTGNAAVKFLQIDAMPSDASAACAVSASVGVRLPVQGPSGTAPSSRLLGCYACAGPSSIRGLRNAAI